MASRPPTKVKRVEEALRRYGALTPIRALSLCGTMDLASIIRKLRNRGWSIRTEEKLELGHWTDDDGIEHEYVRSRYAVYHLEGEPAQEPAGGLK